MEWLPAACLLMSPQSGPLPASVLQSYLTLLMPLLVLVTIWAVGMGFNQWKDSPLYLRFTTATLIRASIATVSWYFLSLSHQVLSTFSCMALPVQPAANDAIAASRTADQAMALPTSIAFVWAVDPDVQCFRGTHAGLTAFVCLAPLPILAAYICLMATRVFVTIKGRSSLPEQAPEAHDGSGSAMRRIHSWFQTMDWVLPEQAEVAAVCWPSMLELLKFVAVVVVVFTQTAPAVQALLSLALVATAAATGAATFTPYTSGRLNFLAAAVPLVIALMAVVSTSDYNTTGTFIGAEASSVGATIALGLMFVGTAATLVFACARTVYRLRTLQNVH
jgi:hypothetical protein